MRQRSWSTAHSRDATAVYAVVLDPDLSANRVQVGTSNPHLTNTEQALLYLLAANPGQAMSRDSIVGAIWGSDFVAESKSRRSPRPQLAGEIARQLAEAQVPRPVAGEGYRFLV